MPTEETPAPTGPAVPGLLRPFEFLTPAEVRPLKALSGGGAAEVWDAVEAAAALGRRAELFLNGGVAQPAGAGWMASPQVRAVVPAATVTIEELYGQLDAAVAAAPPAAVTGADGDSPKKMNPLIAALLVALVQRVAEALLRRLAG